MSTQTHRASGTRLFALLLTLSTSCAGQKLNGVTLADPELVPKDRLNDLVHSSYVTLFKTRPTNFVAPDGFKYLEVGTRTALVRTTLRTEATTATGFAVRIPAADGNQAVEVWIGDDDLTAPVPMDSRYGVSYTDSEATTGQHITFDGGTASYFGFTQVDTRTPGIASFVVELASPAYNREAIRVDPLKTSVPSPLPTPSTAVQVERLHEELEFRAGCLASMLTQRLLAGAKDEERPDSGNVILPSPDCRSTAIGPGIVNLHMNPALEWHVGQEKKWLVLDITLGVSCSGSTFYNVLALEITRSNDSRASISGTSSPSCKQRLEACVREVVDKLETPWRTPGSGEDRAAHIQRLELVWSN